MTQNNVDFSTDPSGDELLDDMLAKEQENARTSNSGTTRPPFAQACTFWVDTTTEPWELKLFNGTDDIVLGYADPTTLIFSPTGAAPYSANSIGLDKLVNANANTFLANGTGSSGARTDVAVAASRIVARLASGDLGPKTISEVLDLLGSTANGDIAIRAGGVWTRVPLDDPRSWTKPQRGTPATPSFSTTMTLDLATAGNFKFTATDNFTLANPTNQVEGQSGMIIIRQDGTGSRIITYGSDWKFPNNGTEPALTTNASAIDALYYYVESANNILCSLTKRFA